MKVAPDSSHRDAMEILGLIIARGGSTRLPKKNILPLGGKPLIVWSIECARKTSRITRTIVSTEDTRIASVARKAGAEVPFKRPPEYATDDAPEFLVIRHALEWLAHNENYHPDLVVLLRASSPFRKPSTVDQAIEALIADPAAHSARSVTKCHEHPHKMWTISGNRLKSFIPLKDKKPEAHNLAYQVLPPVWVQNASFDVFRPSNVWELNSALGTEIIPVEMNEFESTDINTITDFYTAESILRGIAGDSSYADSLKTAGPTP